MKGLALATIGLWVVLQTTYGPLATKIGLITGAGSSSSSGGSGSSSNSGSSGNSGSSIPQRAPGSSIPTPIGPDIAGGAR